MKIPPFDIWLQQDGRDPLLKTLFNQQSEITSFSVWAKTFYDNLLTYSKSLEKDFEQIDSLVSAFVKLNGNMHDYAILKKNGKYTKCMIEYCGGEDETFNTGYQLAHLTVQSQADLIIICQEVVTRHIEEKDVDYTKNNSTERPIFYPDSQRDHLLQFTLITCNGGLEIIAKRFKNENNKITILDDEFFSIDPSKNIGGNQQDLLQGFFNYLQEIKSTP